MGTIQLNYKLTTPNELKSTIIFLKSNYRQIIINELLSCDKNLTLIQAENNADLIIHNIANGFTFSSIIYLSITNKHGVYCEAFYYSPSIHIFWKHHF
jgi:hypothetical protein